MLFFTFSLASREKMDKIVDNVSRVWCAKLATPLHPFHDCGSSMGRSIRRLASASVGLPLACLAVVCLAPTPAHAGCDYPTHAVQTSLDPIGSPFGTADMLKHDARQPSKPCPCNGPGCSREPFTPLPPPSIRMSTVPEWGFLIPRPTFALSSSETHPWENALVLPCGCDSSIFHPPRAIV